MKCLAVFAFAVILVAGGAFAAPSDWTDWQTPPNMVTSGEIRYNNTVPVLGQGGQSFALKTSITLGSTIKNDGSAFGAALSFVMGTNSVTHYAAILLIGGDGSTDIGHFTFYEGNAYVGETEVDRYGVGNILAKAGETYTFVFEYDAEANVLSSYVNDRLLASVAVDYGEDSLRQMVVGAQSGGSVYLNSVNDGYVMGQDEVFSVTRAIPEPSALALLALGVAGLCLRRRVR